MQNVAIIGTTGSIGKAFLEYYLSDVLMKMTLTHFHPLFLKIV